MPSPDHFPRVDFDDGQPATARELIGFWSLLAGLGALWCAGLIWVGYWLAHWPGAAQSGGLIALGVVIGAAAAAVVIGLHINPIRSRA